MYIETQTKRINPYFSIKKFSYYIPVDGIDFLFYIFVITILGNFHSQDEVWTK
jgi:hypothetical protein